MTAQIPPLAVLMRRLAVCMSDMPLATPATRALRFMYDRYLETDNILYMRGIFAVSERYPRTAHVESNTLVFTVYHLALDIRIQRRDSNDIVAMPAPDPTHDRRHLADLDVIARCLFIADNIWAHALTVYYMHNTTDMHALCCNRAFYSVVDDFNLDADCEDHQDDLVVLLQMYRVVMPSICDHFFAFRCNAPPAAAIIPVLPRIDDNVPLPDPTDVEIWNIEYWDFDN
jgi:hypothetical protein